MVRYPSGVAKGQGGPITSGQASSIQRNNLCSVLPTSTPLIPALTLMLQGVFYDPITQRYTLSGLGVRLRFKIVYKDSSQVSPDLCHRDPSVLFVLCICGCKGDQLLKVLSLVCVCVCWIFFSTVIFARCNQVFYFIFISLTVICLTE